MPNNNSFHYHLEGYEPGIHVELYLPKKSRYQGKLYETLTRGFDLDKVKEHFLDPDKREPIAQLLESREQGADIDGRIESLEPFYRGYSMYEADGVFYNPDKKIMEERSQIVRMMFIPNLTSISQSVPGMSIIELRRLVSEYLEGARNITRDLSPDEAAATARLARWVSDIGLFLFGYIVFELCMRIEELNKDREGDLEEEIWISSFWNLRLNRVSLNIDSRDQGDGMISDAACEA